MATKALSQKIITVLTGLSPHTAYVSIFGVLFICGLGVPIPEDITLISAGILASMGTISLVGAMVVGFSGVLIGDMMLFHLGRAYGRRVFKLPVFRRIFTDERIEAAEARVLRNSKFICFTARFLPGLRAPIFLTAGVMGVRPIIFYALDGFAALISVPVWVYVGFYAAENIEKALSIAKHLQIYILLGVGVFIALYFLFRWHSKRRKRREQESAEELLIKNEN